MKVRAALLSEDKAIQAVAKESRYSKDFNSILFIRREILRYYDRKEIGVAVDHNKFLGFVCSHHLLRKPYTSIYYMGISTEAKRRGIGRALIAWTLKQSPWHCIRLVCDDANTEALAFYKAMKFKLIENGQTKGGHPFKRLELKA